LRRFKRQRKNSMTDLIAKGKEVIEYFSDSYQSRYGSRPKINRNTAKWAARDVVESFGIDDCRHAVDWYFRVKDVGHDWSWYANNIEKLINARNEKIKDDEARRVMREKAKAWLNE
jgi:hypothetical protein